MAFADAQLEIGNSPNILQESIMSTGSNASAASGGYVAGNFKRGGILYKERLQTFFDNKWPWVDPRQSTCTPDKLALAGFMYCDGVDKLPSAKCIICSTILSNLQATSDPWKLHAEMNKECLYIRMGKREGANGYTLEEVFQLIKAKHVQIYGNGYKSMQMEYFNSILRLAQVESEELKSLEGLDQ